MKPNCSKNLIYCTAESKHNQFCKNSVVSTCSDQKKCISVVLWHWLEIILYISAVVFRYIFKCYIGPPEGFHLVIANSAGEHLISPLLYTCYWQYCTLFSSVHVSGVHMCVTADHNQYILQYFVSVTAKYCFSFLAPFLQKQTSLKRRMPHLFFFVYLFTKHSCKQTHFHMHTPPMFHHWTTALCIKPSNAATVLARGFRNFQESLWKQLLHSKAAPEKSTKGREKFGLWVWKYIKCE